MMEFVESIGLGILELIVLWKVDELELKIFRGVIPSLYQERARPYDTIGLTPRVN